LQNSVAKKFDVINNTLEVSSEMINTALSHYCSVSTFDDNKWILDKREINQNKPIRSKTIYFGDFGNDMLLNEAKIWASKLMIRKYSTHGISSYISFLRLLTNFIDIANITSFSEINPSSLSKFHHFLFHESKNTTKSSLERWVRVKKFFREMEIYDQYYMMEKFIVPKFPKKRFFEEKYIPDHITKQLDVLFRKAEMPHAYRTFYWVLRLIPNRITEVASMTVNCLKPISSDSYILTIATPKQSGPYESSMLKLIEIKDVGIGAYLIELLEKQVDYTNNLAPSLKTNDFLFFTNSCRFYEQQNFISITKRLRLLDSENFADFLKRICKFHKIKDENGDVFNPKSHQFRHNAISDRMNSGIFRAIDIKPLTGHHTTTMIEQTYTHTHISDLKKNSPIVFRGRIINTDDEERLNRLMEKPFSRRIHHLGICSDSRTCNKSKSQCLRCDYLLPEFENLSYYQHDQSEWQKKKEKAEQIGNVDYAELCQDWIDSYDIAINRVLNAITNENFQSELEELNETNQ